MYSDLINQLASKLATSDAKLRRHWAEQIATQNIPLQSLFSLLHDEIGTSQRFVWLIGDLCERDPYVVAPCLPFLFSLRDQMPFPGMHRSLAKWLWLTGVPESVGGKQTKTWIEQLFAWMEDPTAKVGCKSYAAKGLFELAIESRVSKQRVLRVLDAQSRHTNKAFGTRMKKLFDQLKSE